MLPRPTVRKAKVTDAITGQVMQTPGPWLPGEREMLSQQVLQPRYDVNGRKILPPGTFGMAPFPGAGTGGGGGLPAFGGIRHQRKMGIGDMQGDTVAPRSTGAGDYGGLDAFYKDNPEAYGQFLEKSQTQQGAAPTLAGMQGDAGMPLLPMAAQGTRSKPLPPLQPFIAGDSVDGKPNEELILPTPQGTHVIPLDDLPALPRKALGTLDYGGMPHIGAGAGNSMRELPMMAEGTVTRSMEPGQSDVLTLDSPYGTGFSTNTDPALDPLMGLPAFRPAAPAAAAARASAPALAPAPAPAARPALGPLRDPVEVARERNPEGIIVGVTPREPLTPSWSTPTVDPAQARRRRMERLVNRAAMDDPRLAYALMANEDENAAASAKAQADFAMKQFLEGGRNQRAKETIEAQNARAEAERKRRADEAAVRQNFDLAKESRDAATWLQQFIKPEMSAVPAVGTSGYVDRFAGPKFVGTYPSNQPPPASDVLTMATFGQSADAPPRPGAGTVLRPDAPAAAAPDSGILGDMETFPVQWSATTGKPTRFGLRSRNVAPDEGRDKKIDRLSTLMSNRDKLVPDSTADKLMKAEIDRIMSELGIKLDAEEPQGGAPTASAGRASPATSAASDFVNRILKKKP